MIDPITTNTARVGELPNEPFSLSDKIPHEVGIDLKSGTVQQLVDLVANVIDTTGGVGFRAVSVADGQTLPSTTTQEFILLGKGTYYNVSGGDTIVLTKELNAIVSNGSFWFIGVEIDINAEDLGIVQTIRQGFLETTPSENAVFDGLAGKFTTPTGLTTNYLPKWKGSGFGDSQIFDNGTNLGFGTTTPVEKFDVSGSVRITGQATDFGLGSAGLNIDRISATGLIRIFGVTGAGSAGDLSLGTNNSERIRLTVGGKLLVNTSTDDLTNQLQVNGTISASPAITSNQVPIKSQLDLKADLASPTFTGVPTAPTATAGTNTTQVATTAFVTNADSGNVKTTGNQSITGTKTFNNSVNNSNTLFANITSSQSTGLQILLPNVGSGVNVQNGSFGFSFITDVNSSGEGFRANVNSSGSGFVSVGSTSSSGGLYRGFNNTTETFNVSKTGAITSNALAGTGTRLVNASPTGQLGAISTLPVFADNTAAIAGGLGVGALYRTVIGLLAIVF